MRGKRGNGETVSPGKHKEYGVEYPADNCGPRNDFRHEQANPIHEAINVQGENKNENKTIMDW